jgi:GNAT superfamily N-acetyltransferase
VAYSGLPVASRLGGTKLKTRARHRLGSMSGACLVAAAQGTLSDTGWAGEPYQDGHSVRVQPGRESCHAVEIGPFRSEEQVRVRALILEGLEEHWGGLDPELNADLDDIEATYASGTVLVARHDERILGVGMVVPAAPLEGEVKRMSVARSARRRGIGTALLRELVAAARREGWRVLRLETTAEWDDAVRFYIASGFVLSHHEHGVFGRDAFFRLDLTPRLSGS